MLYSSSTIFVFTLGAGVNGFTLDPSLGEFILTHPHIQIPPRGHIYSINSANRRTWDKPTQVFIDSLADGTRPFLIVVGPRHSHHQAPGKQFSAVFRYGGIR